MRLPLRFRLIAVAMALSVTLATAGGATAAAKLRFAVGPYQPTPGETRAAFEPFFKHLAEQLGVDYELTVTTDWAGIAVALASDHTDVAWMGAHR